jgi:hypothetical protein
VDILGKPPKYQADDSVYVTVRREKSDTQAQRFAEKDYLGVRTGVGWFQGGRSGG